jgi:hypothetical protein
MTADINLIVFNYNFLKSLHRERNILSSDIKLKFKGFDTPKTYTSLYHDLGSMIKYHPQMSLSATARKCLSGDSSEIEELLITNNNFPFYNEFHVYNITGTIRIVEKVRLNELNNDFYTSEIQRYKKMIEKIFSNYLIVRAEYKARIDECYVQSCYVDNYYNCGDPQSKVVDDTFYPDLSIDAGPGIFQDITLGPNIPFAYTVGATHTTFEGATLKWTSSSPDVLFDDDTLLITNISLADYTLGGSSSLTSTLTLTVTYPWGPILIDTRKLTAVKYYGHGGHGEGEGRGEGGEGHKRS